MIRILFLIFYFVPFLVIAQSQDSLVSEQKPSSKGSIQKYKSTSFSIPYKIVKDEGHSSITYQNISYQLSRYNERIRKNAFTKLEFIAGVGFLKTNKKKVSVVTQAPALYLEINYHYMRFIRKFANDKIDFYLGGIFTNTFDGRLYSSLINNSFGYEFSNVLNPATQLVYTLNTEKYNRKIQLGFKLNTALIAHVIRPNYIGMEPIDAYEGEDINALALLYSNNKIALPNQFFRVNTELYFDRFQLSNNNKIRVFYGWGFHYTNYKQTNPLYTAHHTIGIVNMLYSDKKKVSIFKRKINQAK